MLCHSREWAQNPSIWTYSCVIANYSYCLCLNHIRHFPLQAQRKPTVTYCSSRITMLEGRLLICIFQNWGGLCSLLWTCEALSLGSHFAGSAAWKKGNVLVNKALSNSCIPNSRWSIWQQKGSFSGLFRHSQACLGAIPSGASRSGISVSRSVLASSRLLVESLERLGNLVRTLSWEILSQLCPKQCPPPVCPAAPWFPVWRKFLGWNLLQATEYQSI